MLTATTNNTLEPIAGVCKTIRLGRWLVILMAIVVGWQRSFLSAFLVVFNTLSEAIDCGFRVFSFVGVGTGK